MPTKGAWIEQIGERTRNGKKRIDSLDPRRFALDLTIGSLHYKDNPQDEGEQWKEIDNIFEPALAPWTWQMLKAGYHIRVKEDFTAGQIIEFEKQGETIQFQPMALEWTNDLDQIQPISMPQGVTPVITNPEVDLLPAVGMPSHQGTIRWNDAYGEGINFEWRCTSTRLVKILEVESLSKLPVPEQFILDGGNPVLRLNLIFDASSGVDIHIDGELWNRRTKKQTFGVLEFHKDGEVLWGFMPLRYWGSGTEPKANKGQSVASLEKRGNKLYISVRVPYEWLETAVFPVFIDVDVDVDIAASSDDADNVDAWSTTHDMFGFGENWGDLYAGTRFTGCNIPSGAIVSASHVTFIASDENVGTSCDIIAYCEDATNPATYSTVGNFNGRSWIGTGSSWPNIGAWTDGNSYDSASLNATLNAVLASKALDEISIKWANDGMGVGTEEWRSPRAWDYWEAPKLANLHIEYTAAAVAIPRHPVVNFQDPGIV